MSKIITNALENGLPETGKFLSPKFQAKGNNAVLVNERMTKSSLKPNPDGIPEKPAASQRKRTLFQRSQCYRMGTMRTGNLVFTLPLLTLSAFFSVVSGSASNLRASEPLQYSSNQTRSFTHYVYSDQKEATGENESEPESTIAQETQASADSVVTDFKERLEEEEPKTLGERLDKLGLLYSNSEDPFIQEAWFLGRYHGQYHASDGEAGGDSDWENRRFRIGTQIKLLEKMTFHAQMISSTDMEQFYNGFSELWVSWKFNDAFAVSIGQQKHRFTHERNVSSRYINTLERSMIVNMFNSDYTPAITASGEVGDWIYYTGFFSNATSSDMGDAFTNFDSGYSYLMSMTKDLGEKWGTDSTHWNSCFLHSEANENATNWNHFENGFSTALIMTKDRRYLIAEGVIGTESESGNAYGLNLQPGTFLTDNLQFTTRYQIAASSDDFGLEPQRRYERPAGMSSGDFYQAIYGGLNYYFAEHRIKTMSGLEYSNMDGEGLWTASIMFRTYWGPHSSGPFPMAQTL